MPTASVRLQYIKTHEGEDESKCRPSEVARAPAILLVMRLCCITIMLC